MQRKLFIIMGALILMAGLLSLSIGCSSSPASSSVPATSVAPTSTQAQNATITLKVSCSSPQTISVGEALDWWAKEVESRTNGRVKFQMFWNGSVLKGGEGLHGAQTGQVDIVELNGPLYPDRLPFTNIGMSVIYGPDDVNITRELDDWLFAQPALQKEYDQYNVKYLFAVPISSRDFNTTFPLQTLNDLKGKKIASIGTYYPRALAAVGAVGVTVAINDRYMALKTGVVQGQMLPVDSAYDIKGYEVAKYITFAHLACDINGPVIINKDSWNKLPSDIQKIMIDTSKDAEVWNAQNLLNKRKNDQSAMEKMGVAFYDFPLEEQVKWTNVMDDYPEEWAKGTDSKGLPGTEVMQEYLAKAQELGYKFPRQWIVK